MASTCKKLLAVTCLSIMLLACCLTSYGQTQYDKTRVEKMYFDYSDGVVRDGDRHDRAGIIGDEFDYYEYYDGNSVHRRASYDEGNSERATEEQSKAVTFWGIAASLLVIGAVILLIALVTPKNRKNNR